MIHAATTHRVPSFRCHAIALASAMSLGFGVNATAQVPPSGLSAQESVQQVYLAFYGRPGDPAGVSYWSAEAGAKGVAGILDQFSSSLEANQLFAGMSNEGKVTFIYRVLFNRDPDGPGLAYWASELSGGKRTLQEISYQILQGAQNDDLGKIQNKVAAATYFSDQLQARGLTADYSVQADIFLARNWLGTVGSSAASLDAARVAIGSLLDRISLAGKSQTITGVLVAPSNATQSGRSAAYFMPAQERSRLRGTGEARVAMEAGAPSDALLCFGVPDGYAPLANASVAQVDPFGAPVAPPTTADRCGMFVAAAGASVTALDITAPNHRTVRTAVTAFQDPDGNQLPDALTLIPDTSNYQLSGVRLQNQTRLMFTLTDSATNKAILGVVPGQVSITNNGMPAVINNFGYGATLSQSPASVALVLDGSGSMFGTPLQVAAASARLFVSRKSSTDELSLTIFDDQVIFLDQAGTDGMVAQNRLTFSDGSGAPLTLQPPVNGYSTNPLFAEQMLKLYHNQSESWKRTDPFFQVTGGYYPYGGSTALYSAALKGVQSLDGTANRRYAIVMTDGYDNASGRNTPDTVINAAKAGNVATFTVAAGTSVDARALQRMATETGGTYTQVKDMSQVQNLSAVFDAIRTNIAYGYAVDLIQPAVPGSLTLSLDIGGLVVDAVLPVTP